MGYFCIYQIGPIHLGMFGVVSIYLFFVWFFLVGFGMLQQVNFDFALFIRTLFWLSLNPPQRCSGGGQWGLMHKWKEFIVGHGGLQYLCLLLEEVEFYLPVLLWMTGDIGQ